MKKNPTNLVAALDYRAAAGRHWPCARPIIRAWLRTIARPARATAKPPSARGRTIRETPASEAVLRQLWADVPTANVGLALGPVSGLIALDIDGDTGELLLKQLSQGDLPDTLEFSTGKGRRLLYAHPGDTTGIEVRNEE